MKRAFFILSLIATTIVANAQKRQTPEQRAKLEAKHGIRDIKLDTPKSLYNDLYEVKNEFPCGQMMKRANENLFIGKAKVDGIRYLYIKDTLNAIFLDFEYSDNSASNYQYLSSVLTNLYGPLREKVYEMDGTSGCRWGKEYAWYAETFTIETHFYGFTSPISFIKNDLYDKCSKLSGQEKP